MTARDLATIVTSCGWLGLLLACDPSSPSGPDTAAPSAQSRVDGTAVAGDTSTPAVPAPASTTADDDPPTSESAPTVVAIDQDRTLRALRAALPAGWRLLTQEDRLIVERNEPVWVLAENRINAPADDETPAERSARIEQHGRRMQPRIVYRAESGWSDALVRSIRADNERRYQRIAALPDLHQVRSLLDVASRRKHSDPRIGASAEELPRLDQYEAERKKIEAELRPLPAYLSEHYGLFPGEHEAWSDAYHLVHPEEAAQECYRTDEAVRSLLAREGSTVE